jgi:formamidase
MTVHLSVDRSRSVVDDPANSHNRWSPDVEPVARLEPGEELIAELRDGMDGELDRARDSSDLAGVDLDANHPLTGPVWVDGAEAGDALVVDILEVVPAPTGATAVIPGFGLLGDQFDEPMLVRWTIEDGVARSPDIPGVAIAGRPFVGTVGVAPSVALVERATAREQAVIDAGDLALPPLARHAVPATEPYASTGLRTIPPRENGGNLDIPQLTAGSRVVLPVQVSGALLSLGDAHFAQGEGEVCGTAIEISATVRVRVGLQRAGEGAWTPRFPAYEFQRPARASGERRCIATTGVGLADDGSNGALDITLAARRALEQLVEQLEATRGLTRAQAYVLASVAADLRISEAVNVPNALVSAVLPLDVCEAETGARADVR